MGSVCPAVPAQHVHRHQSGHGPGRSVHGHAECYGAFSFSGLAAGQSETRQYSSGCNVAPEATADSLNQVAGSDETNNVRKIGPVFC